LKCAAAEQSTEHPPSLIGLRTPGDPAMFSLTGVTMYVDWNLLFLRLVVALVFGTSGFNHLSHPRERAKSIGMSLPFTVFLGAAELSGAIALVVGILTQWAAVGLILVMLGAIYTKIAKWKTGFWGEKSMGWHYEVLLIAMLLVILTTNGGKYTL
jgi:putative oxidoreductase